MKVQVPCFFLALVPFFLSSTFALNDKSKQLFDEGNEYFIKGNYDEALKSFDDAIKLDSENHRFIFKRAATNMHLKRNSAAVQDFTKILNLRPDFEPALLQRAKIYLNEGSFFDAEKDLQKILDNEEASNTLKNVGLAKELVTEAENATEAKDYVKCIEKISEAIRISLKSPSLRSIRAKCHLEKGEIEEGVRDLTTISQLAPDDPNLLIRLCRLNYFSLYDFEQARNNLKQCMRYDPEHKACKNLHRLIKKIEKEVTRINNDIQQKRWLLAINKLIGTSSNKWQGLITEVENELKNMNEGIQKKELKIKLYSLTCKAYQQSKNSQKAMKWCSDTLKMDENNVDAIISRAETYIDMEDFDAAINDYNKANELTQDQEINPSVRKRLSYVHKLLKQSKKKDYYKILGVSRTADKREIKKAYRKLAHEWHPDKYRGDLSEDQVATKMSSINEAYEVLMSDELRARFDNGDDPNDPNGGNQPFFYHDFMQFSNGFHFAGFPFGGGDGNGEGHQFKFNFN
ncbi:hypothetical protein Glove_452g4 [Diversispora epigaea]|uniref:Tetratricopeptide repeat and J domain-containing co-chaperone DNJ1 n=1 Tax=Diversispora epigaea TaxID=1348612 RepID=A0A397GTP4_9GLOM|nr:hypothetical protein Glove_452g4 [Diversispora epigaea]